MRSSVRHVRRMLRYTSPPSKEDSMVEDMFQFMQFSTCFFFSLSQGANDVVNAVGPFSVVWMVYSTGKTVESKVPTPTWILVYGGITLDIGILTMDHQIMKELDNRLTIESITWIPHRAWSHVHRHDYL